MQDQINKIIAYPGKFLGYIYDYSLGETGVYKKEDKIFASISGEIIINTSFKPSKISVKNQLSEYLPKINDELYLKVTKVTKTIVIGEILATKDKVIRAPIMGLIKSDNLKQDFKEIDLFECYVPGDIVFCKVLSIDQTNYVYLSTSEPIYGVVFARSPLTKNLMLPVNYEKMMCLDTNLKENRKVAKPNFL
jgi:exosome complex RNA-binding protein Csl4